jgi:SecD/SecF fusion protein
MNPSLKWRVPLLAILIALAFHLVTPPFDPDGEGPREGKLKLGLDLQGGMHLVLRVDTEALPLDEREDATERALEIIRNRIDQFGVSEPSIQRQSSDQIVLQLPGISDRKRAIELIGKTALLEFKLVSDDIADDEQPPAGTKNYPQKDGSNILLNDEVLLQGKNLTDASVQYSSDWNEPVVSITFDSEGAKRFADITSKYVNEQLAILLDGVVQSAPVIREPILTGEAQISGSFALKEASDLAITLRAGALPAPIIIEEERTVGATLGHDSVEQGIGAMWIAGALVLAFMAIYYLGCGLIVNFALLLNILMIGASLSYFKATLTLPGIAGIILTIGMAVDTNVLILERIREEFALGKAASAAIAAGYRKAFSAILDSNLTTLITALILFNFGTGPVRGFALTLAIGIVGSFLTGIFVTRMVFELFLGMKNVKRLPMLALLKHAPHLSFLSPRKFLFPMSVILIVACFVLIHFRINQAYGIDFTGGALQEYRFKEPVAIDDIRNSLREVNLEKAIIQTIGNDREIVIRTGQGAEEEIPAILRKSFPNNLPELRRVEKVGPIVGQELRRKSVLAVVFSLLTILIYLAIRFEFRYSIAAIAALFHDAVICIGALVFTGRELSIPVLAAILTIVGYSVNDTIVTFDRIRENSRRKGKTTFKDTVNKSINETLSRTLLTSLTTFFVVLSLYLFGGPVINDFAFTMMVGVIAGTYSTMFIACPIVVDWPWSKKISR